MINIIVAFSENYVIGSKGKIPWNIPKDMARFKELTMGNLVVMGRKTFQGIGKPLPGRFNIVVSSSLNIIEENCISVKSLAQAVEKARCLYPEKEIFVCGGESLYREAFSIADRLYVTHVKGIYKGDVFFPVRDFSDFTETQRVETIECTFSVYEKI